MTFKKIMLVASMALAAVAFAAPAAQAEAPEWWDMSFGTEETLESERTVRLTAELSSIVVGSALVSGPCHINFEGTAANFAGMATRPLEAAAIQEHCNTSIPGCTFTSTLNIGAGWPLTGLTVTGEEAVEINEASFTNHYNATCQAYGVPATLAFSGTMTALLDEKAPTGECITFEEHLDDMFINGNPLAPRVDILGTACIEAPYTLH